MASEIKPAHHEASVEQAVDDLSSMWCSSAIQAVVLNVNQFEDSKKVILSETDEKLDDESNIKKIPQRKFDDLKSWLLQQQTISPELNCNLRLRKKWFFPRNTPWKGLFIKKWVKDIKHKRKDDDRLQGAEMRAAISLAELAVALAAIAAENASPVRPNVSRETAVATAAALIAAQCTRLAEAVGATCKQLDSAISTAMTATHTNSIITLTAAAATSLKGAATLRQRPGSKERIKGSSRPIFKFDDHDFDFGRCRKLLAKGEEFFVRTSDGKCRLRLVSITLNKDAKLIIKIRKINFLCMSQESVIHEMQIIPLEEHPKDIDSSYSATLTTSKGKIELKTDDGNRYKKWTTTIDHMLRLSTTFSKYELQF